MTFTPRSPALQREALEAVDKAAEPAFGIGPLAAHE
jgi:hypothetical protein